jgi:hypothetical protein
MAKKWFALLFALTITGVVMAAGGEAVMLKYMVNEPGMQPYPSRIIVTPGVIRMDDGSSGGDYLLFDREKQLISSVTHEDETVLEIPLHEVRIPSPLELKRHHTLEPDAEAPRIEGHQPHKLRLFVNDRHCFDAVVVPGLLPDTVQGLMDFRRVLAGEQGKMVAELPLEMIEGCDLALHTYHPEWPLESGLVVQEWDESLRRGRLLVDIQREFEAAPALFSLPAGYRRYRTP